MTTLRYIHTCLGLAAAMAASIPSALAASAVDSPFHNNSTPVSRQPALQLAQSGSVENYLLVEQLQQEVRELRGLIEEQGNQIEQLKQQQRDRYVDLDQRLLNLEKQGTAGAPATTSAPAPAAATNPAAAPAAASNAAAAPAAASNAAASAAPATTPNNGAAEEMAASKMPVTAQQQQEYQAAYDLIRQKQYDKAVEALHSFITKYPDSDLTANAYYWLGEVYLVLPKLEQAKQAFIIVVSKYPTHRKAADALYKLGVTHQRMGDATRAREYFSDTIKRYPNSSAANLAQEQLKTLQ